MIAHSLSASFLQLVHGNSFLSGGLVLGTLGAAVASMSSVPARTFLWLRDSVITSFEVSAQDPSFFWFQHWLSGKEFSKRSRRFLLSTSRGVGASESSTQTIPEILLTPAPGLHMFKHEGKWFWLHIKRENLDNASYGVFYRDSFTVSSFLGNKEIFREMTRQAYKASCRAARKGLRIFSYQGYNGWVLSNTKEARPSETLILDGDLYTTLEEDAKRFLEGQQWYSDMSIPWHRGYLLYGPPGSGKSSIVNTIASSMGLDIYIVNLSCKELREIDLMKALASIPINAILLLEEMDTVFKGREKNEKAGTESSISFGGLLNALDGVAAPEGRMVFMTTNHAEHLDPALTRPGRIDVQLHIDNASKDQARRLFAKFFPDASPYQLADVYSLVPDRVLSMASLQEACMRNLRSFAGALAAVIHLAEQVACVNTDAPQVGLPESEEPALAR